VTRALFRVTSPEGSVTRPSVVVDVTDQPPTLRRDVAEDRGARFLGVRRDLVRVSAIPIPRARRAASRVWT